MAITGKTSPTTTLIPEGGLVNDILIWNGARWVAVPFDVLMNALQSFTLGCPTTDSAEGTIVKVLSNGYSSQLWLDANWTSGDGSNLLFANLGVNSGNISQDSAAMYVANLTSTPLYFYTNSAIQVAILSSGNIEFTKLISKYNNIATEGYGIPAILKSIDTTALAADVSATSLSNTATAGKYRVGYYLETSSSDITAGTVTLNLDWSNAGKTYASPSTLLLTGTGVANYIQGEVFVRHSAASSSSIRYSTTHTGIFGTAQYELRLSCERIS